MRSDGALAAERSSGQPVVRTLGARPEANAPPRLSRIDAALLSGDTHLAPLAVALVESGRVTVRTETACSVTLTPGALAMCGSQPSIQLSARAQSGAAAIVLELSKTWLAAGLQLAGVGDRPTIPDSGFLEPEGADAVGLARKLRHAWTLSTLGTSTANALEWASRWLEIAASTWAASWTPLDGEPPASDAPVRRIRSHAILSTLVRLAAHHDGNPPALHALAAELELSERQTSRLFRDQMGMSFREYTQRLRIDRAMELLERTDQPVTEVALSSGWNSLSQFNAAFRKHTGSTPGGYRRRRQNGSGSEYWIENE